MAMGPAVSWEGFRGDGLVTAAEVASTMRVSTMTVYRLIQAGDLPATRIGRSYRIRRSDLETYLATRRVEMR
jgi:excisionase family DNA binding protein